MKTLEIDIETFSSADLKKCGMYRYAESPDFEILLFAYSVDDGPVDVVDLAMGEEIPEDVLSAVTDPSVLKYAHNAAFERTCLAAAFGKSMPAEQWRCTMVLAGMAGYPFSLDAAAKAMRLDQKKNTEGKPLIRYFCIPCKPTKANGMRTRNLPEDAIEKWLRFIKYAGEDVLTEQAIREKLAWFEVPEKEQRLWELDQRINDYGIKLDVEFVRAAMRIDAAQRESLIVEAVEITKLTNPNSAAQLIKWLSEEMPFEVVEKLRKQDIPGYKEAAKTSTSEKKIIRVLEIRQELSKTSIKKYAAMLQAVCSDGRLRGLHQFYGANRTGRWAGRLVQPQNMTKNDFEKVIKYLKGEDVTEIFRNDVKYDNGELIKMLGCVSEVLSGLIRTALTASGSNTLGVSDFSAIEARVIAWLAGEQWRLDVFATHGKIYEASASKMFGIPLEDVTKGSVYRQKGKMAELALGYQGGMGALVNIEISNGTPPEKRIGALGIEKGKVEVEKNKHRPDAIFKTWNENAEAFYVEREYVDIVKAWRKANPNIVKLWYACERAALSAVRGTSSEIQFGIKFFMRKGSLHIQLPSGRCLVYVRPSIYQNKYDKDAIRYEGMNQTTKQWCRQETYGGKLVENIVQAIARDLLGEKLLDTDAAGLPIVLHVHDELNADILPEAGHLDRITEIMKQPVDWAPGLPLNADSYETQYYQKKD